ncbi:MAG: ABC transporter ATP-binding protein [Clostridiales bacterium]|nr:ABC transporter ATP-binding protein [Clostridiales bacterium]MDU3243837.1 ABC transporter ATP-binding protein [Clostridiales bacterium]
MRKLIKYLKGYEKESIIGPLFKLLEACLELLVPLVMSRIIDIGIKNADLPYILKMGAVLIGFGVLGLTCSLTAQYFAAKAATGFGTELRKDLFSHINGLSYTELDTIGTSTLVTRITSDINQAQAGVNLVLRLFLRSPFIVLGAVIMAFTINVKLAWIFVVLVPVLSIVIYGIMMISIPIYKKVQNKLDKVLLITRENLTGARVIRAFSRQKEEIEDFDRESSQLMGIQLLVGRISALLNPITYVVVNAAIIIVLWFGGKTVYSGIITQGELIALINYMSQILLALVALASLIISFTKASASAIRINDVFEQKSDMKEGDTPVLQEEGAPKVVFDNVCFAYKGNKDSLTNLSFAAKAGQTIGIIGGTGSGKSTLVNLIPRFYDVREGAVKMDGVNVKDYPFGQLRSKVGVVPQNAVLFAGTIRDNMKWGKKDASDEEIYRALEIAQAKEFVDDKPEGLDTKILQGGKNLSGGQRQRLTIARALVGKPEVLILDDSASALDFATDAKLRKAITDKTKGMTVFIVSQRATTIRGANQIIVLDDGAVAGIGTHLELFETCEVYKEICLSQLSEKELGKS